ncbi:MAG TPA: carboxypeptidase regulatory-like domain-containing protein [Planctomycetaceae bacterium]|nr:carboxypeptidase regulatory-like domain-containing protein [Planctomycetaceae bacterium]
MLVGGSLAGSIASEPSKGEAGPTLAGRVIDGNGRPVAGAGVRLLQYDVPGARAEGTSDSSGRYRFDELPAGSYVLVASAAGLARSFRPTSLEGDGQLALDIVLRRPVVPIIELRDEQNRPVAGARLRELRLRGDIGSFFLRRIDWDTFGVTVSPSDAQGRLRLPPLPEGTILTATFDHHQQAPVRIRDVPAAEGTIAKGTMQRGVPLTLRIQPDASGATVTDLSLELHHDPFDHPATIRDRIAVGRDGTAALAVEAGEYNWLRLQHEDFFVTPMFIPRAQERLRIDPAQNGQISFHLHRKVQVRGRVVDISTGRPLAGMSVLGYILNHTDPASAAGFPNEWAPAGWAETDANGEYMVSLAAGRARLLFDGDTYVGDQDEIELDVAADGSTVAPDFNVRPISKIAGTVLDSAGEPVARAVVRVRGRYLGWPPLLTDERGRFELQPPWIPTADVSDERLPAAPIVAFHPYEPLSASVTVRLNDAEAVANIRLTLEKRDYESVLSDFAGEMPGWQRGDTSSVPDAADRLARSLRGRPAPELDGAAWLNTERPQMSLADFRGQYVLLDFWFINCGPCHADFPSVKLVHELYKDHGVTVIGVHDNSATPEAVRAHVQKEGLEFPIVVDHPDGRIVAEYQTHAAVPGFPSYVLIGPDGNVVHVDYTVPAPSLRTYTLEIIRRYVGKAP